MNRLLSVLGMTLPLSVSTFLFPLILVLWLGQQGAPAWVISLNSTSSGLALLLTIFVMPGVLRRWPTWVVMAAGSVIAALSIGAVALWPVLAVMLLARFIYGVGFTLNWGAGESWINVRCEKAILGRALGAYMVIWYLPMPLAPIILSWFSAQADVLLWLIAGLLLISPLVLWPLRKDPALSADNPVVHWRSWQLAPMPVVAGFLSGGLEGVRGILVPVYLARLNWPEVLVLQGVFWLAIGGLAFNIVSGWLADRLRPERVLLALATLGAAGSFFLGWYLLQPTPLKAGWVAGFILLGGCLNTVYSLASGAVGRYVPASDRLEANSILMLTYTLGMLTLPLLGGVALDHFGPSAFMPMLAGAFAVLLAVVIKLRIHAVP